MNKIINFIINHKRKSLQAMTLVLVLLTLGIVFRKNISVIFADVIGSTSCSRSTWTAYDYTNDEINGQNGWWNTKVKDYYQTPSTTVEEKTYNFNLRPVAEAKGLVSNTGNCVNKGAGFNKYAVMNAWVYSFGETEIALKIYGITIDATTGEFGPIYSYRVYNASGTLIDSQANSFDNNLLDPVIIKATVPGKGAYRVELSQNFSRSTVKPKPGYPLSFGYQKDKMFPAFSKSQDAYFFVPENIANFFADIRVWDSNDRSDYKLLSPGVNKLVPDQAAAINPLGGEVDRHSWFINKLGERASFANPTGGALISQPVTKSGIWKIESGNYYLEQLFFHNVPNVIAGDQQSLMVSSDLLSQNGLTEQADTFNIDQVSISGTGSKFDGDYLEKIDPPNVGLPKTLTPSSDPKWQVDWDNKLDQTAIYQHATNPNIFIVRSIAKDLNQGDFISDYDEGGYFIFDQTSPTTEWYFYKAADYKDIIVSKASRPGASWHKTLNSGWNPSVWTTPTSLTMTFSCRP